MGRVKRLLHHGTLDMSTPRLSQTVELPQDVLEEIISHVHDTETLLACSRTCRSWYFATLPHLYYFLSTNEWEKSKDRKWPKRLKIAGDLRLLPLVKQLRIRQKSPFTLELLKKSLPYLPALTNLRELGIDYLFVSEIIPKFEQYFGHIAPNLQFLALNRPQGSFHEIMYFIGLFKNLQDLKLSETFGQGEEWEANLALTPVCNPPLGGRLTLSLVKPASNVEKMIKFFGRLRFRSIDLYMVQGANLVLTGCAETLETLQLHAADEEGEYFSRANPEMSSEVKIS